MTRIGQNYRSQLVNSLKEGLEENDNVFVLSYSHMSGMPLSELRKSLKKTGARMFVSKNSLARIALKELKQEKLAESIGDQTAFVFGGTDSVEISKVLVKYAKDLETFRVRGGLLGEKELAEGDVTRLSELPSRDVLLAQLLATIQAPVTRLLGAFNAKSRELLSILKQYSEQKGGKNNG